MVYLRISGWLVIKVSLLVRKEPVKMHAQCESFDCTIDCKNWWPGREWGSWSLSPGGIWSGRRNAAGTVTGGPTSKDTAEPCQRRLALSCVIKTVLATAFYSLRADEECGKWWNFCWEPSHLSSTSRTGFKRCLWILETSIELNSIAIHWGFFI